MAGLVAEICELQRRGHRMVLVSSGAVSSGMGLLRLKSRPTEVVDQQAAAAVGQGHLYHAYSQLFGHEEVLTAQVLLTAFDISARAQYLNARNTLRRLLEWAVVPIINENDTTSTDELTFGDNDTLAAQVALLVSADLLVLLTDMEGLYTADPRDDPSATLIHVVESFDDLADVDTDSKGELGSGWHAQQGGRRPHRHQRRSGDGDRAGLTARGHHLVRGRAKPSAPGSPPATWGWGRSSCGCFTESPYAGGWWWMRAPLEHCAATGAFSR